MIAAIKKTTAVTVFATLVGFGVLGGAAAPAQAACVGENARHQVTWDTAEVKMDSCVSRDLVNAYGDVGSATGLATLIGAKWPGVSYLMAPFYAWAWNNGARVRDCEVAHTGITFNEISGIIVGCTSQ